MNVRATAKFVGTSSRKVGLAAAMIRGQQAQTAVTTLSQAPQRAGNTVGKVLASAIANAENNFNLNARNLVVEEVLVGPGRTLKRFRPRAQGRAYPIRKRTSHITVVLRDDAAPSGKQNTVAKTGTSTSTPPEAKTPVTTKKEAA